MKICGKSIWRSTQKQRSFCKKPLAHYKQLHEVLCRSVATGKYAFSSIVENIDDNEDDDVSNVDDEGAVTNSNSVAVVEVRTPRPFSSLSKDTENSVKSDVCVTAGKAGKRKRKVSK
jgi:hypothetical protein